MASAVLHCWLPPESCESAAHALTAARRVMDANHEMKSGGFLPLWHTAPKTVETCKPQ